MLPLPYTNRVAGVVFGVGVAAILVVQLRTAVLSNLTIFRSRGRMQRLDRWSLPFVGLTSGLGVVGAVEAAAHVRGAAIAPGVPVVRWIILAVGVAAMVGGAAFRQWAVSTLGRFFTFDVRITEGQQVVEGGPYRWLRHPSYTGLLVSFLGISLAFGNWLSIAAIAVLPTIGLIRRIQVEEVALLAGIGEPYARFAATRRRLVPGVW